MEQQTTPVKKQRILSGIQPSGTPTLGNYIGAMRNWKLLEDEYDCLYMIADLHAITVRQEPAKLRAQSIHLLALLLAIGLDPEKNVLFFQSHVHQHAEMNWLLNCYTYMGEMSRMTQFKDKSAKHADNINCGLFTYPVLMAGDILLYQANLVPVGVDQTQHLEICRDIATRFNGLYGNVFTIPEGYYPKLGARVMSLQDPKRKMSKSDPDDCFISMLDGADVVRRKLRRAVTDSDSEIRFDAENKPGVSNLLAMLCALTGEPMDKTVESFAGKGYGDLKSTVADAIIATLEPIQADYNRYMGDKAYLETVYRQGAERAGRLAERTLSKAMKKIGFIAKITPSVCLRQPPPSKREAQTVDKKLFSPRRGRIALSANERIAEFLDLAIQAKFAYVNKLHLPQIGRFFYIFINNRAFFFFAWRKTPD